jgi:hypothetical protein
MLADSQRFRAQPQMRLVVVRLGRLALPRVRLADSSLRFGLLMAWAWPAWSCIALRLVLATTVRSEMRSQ